MSRRNLEVKTEPPKMGQNFRVGLSPPGTDVMVLKIFSPKELAKIFAFLHKLMLLFCKNLIITLVLRKTPIFFAESDNG
jgi:hypothetical protein